jgi:hypothetical protein
MLSIPYLMENEYHHQSSKKHGKNESHNNNNKKKDVEKEQEILATTPTNPEELFEPRNATTSSSSVTIAAASSTKEELKPITTNNENKPFCTSSNNEKYVIDPLSTIIKLAILSKKKIGTKCGVYNNVLYIHDAGIYQAIIRYIYTINKIEIQYLYNPIEIACAQYLSTDYVKKNPNIIQLFKIAQDGISNLIQTYKEHTHIVHLLYLDFNIIQNYLSNCFNANFFIKDEMTQRYYDRKILEKSLKIWTAERISILVNMIEFISIETLTPEIKNIKFLEEFMVQIDDEFQIQIAQL